MLTLNAFSQAKHDALHRLADFNTQATDFALSFIVTVSLIVTCLAIAPLVVGAHAWARCIKHR